MLGYQLEHQSDKYDQLVLSYKKLAVWFMIPKSI